MQALTEIKPGENCTVKWMVTGARIAEWMENIVLQKGAGSGHTKLYGGSDHWN